MYIYFQTINILAHMGLCIGPKSVCSMRNSLKDRQLQILDTMVTKKKEQKEMEHKIKLTKQGLLSIKPTCATVNVVTGSITCPPIPDKDIVAPNLPGMSYYNT